MQPQSAIGRLFCVYFRRPSRDTNLMVHIRNIYPAAAAAAAGQFRYNSSYIFLVRISAHAFAWTTTFLNDSVTSHHALSLDNFEYWHIKFFFFFSDNRLPSSRYPSSFPFFVLVLAQHLPACLARARATAAVDALAGVEEKRGEQRWLTAARSQD